MYLGKIYTSKEREWPVSEMEGAPDDTKAIIKIRLLKPGEIRELFYTGFKTVYSPDESGSMHPEMKSEHHKASENLFYKAVTGWEGIYEDADGNVPLKFGQAGKTKLLSLVPELADFVDACHLTMVKEAEAEKEDVTKNSLSGSSASKKSPTAKPAKS
jgi:hypothetical protein